MQIKSDIKPDSHQHDSVWLQFYFEINRLKLLYRQGWLKRGIPKEVCESVAEHSFGLALIALLLASQSPTPLNLEKVLTLALIHDLGEIHAGDITPVDGILSSEKYQLELASIKKTFEKLPNGQKYILLWEEYESGKSPEAEFIRQIDRLEMGLQACVYEWLEGNDLTEFMKSAESALELPPLKQIMDDIYRSRPTSF
ncbi:MAG: HD domain-containing protein [SAR324 cluster bacterium]|nr:HD domain-containing protein [SAR324 cluster bacterium]